MRSLASLAKDWNSLSAEFRPNAFWFWNSELDDAAIDDAVDKFAGAGFRAIAIHPLNGLLVEYLSNEYFKLYRRALTKIGERGMKAWIYDELAWPSGVVGGALLREHPEFRGWRLAFEKDAAGKISARPEQAGYVLDATIGTPWAGRETGYLDTLSKDAVAKFIEMTHERYFSECGDFFGKTVEGFFTDEPASMMGPPPEGHGSLWDAASLPWTPALPAKFKERYGYDIAPLYDSLSVDGEAKADYWELAAQMHVEAYHKQIGDWCRAHGVKYTGHCGEDSLLMQQRFAGNIYQALSQMDEPGIDYLRLHPSNNPEARWQDEVLVPSIARRAGRKRVFCEAFAVSPFDIRLSAMLRALKQFGLSGIDDIAFMCFHQSAKGVRKRSFWPLLFQQAPFWPHFRDFNEIAARALALSALGEPMHRYAVLYPQFQLEQTDVFLKAGKPNPAADSIRALGSAIYESGETFDFIFPENLDGCVVEDGRLKTPDGATREFVIAPAEIQLDVKTGEQLERLAREGAKILRETSEEIARNIKTRPASWKKLCEISCDGPRGALRVHRFKFEDGETLALRNVSESAVETALRSELSLAEWRPDDNAIFRLAPLCGISIPPHETAYVSLSSDPLGETRKRSSGTRRTRALKCAWRMARKQRNIARLQELRYLDEASGEWIPGEASPKGADCQESELSIPRSFGGRERIRFSALFKCEFIPRDLSALFEAGYLVSLSVNGNEIKLEEAAPTEAWDPCCRAVPIAENAKIGLNKIEGELRFPAFETEIKSDAFYSFHPMPTADVFLMGSFSILDGGLSEDCALGDAPMDLSRLGRPDFSGTILLESEIATPGDAVALKIEPVNEDCVEVALDGVSLGRRFGAPYEFPLPAKFSGRGELSVKISNSSMNQWRKPEPWGLKSASLVCEKR